MPKERIYGARITDATEPQHDALVQWGKVSEGYNGRDGYVWLTAVAQADDVCQAPVLLDRDGLNRLIRVLRRARDNAFGADA